MRITLVVMLFIMMLLITGCTVAGPVPLVINKISPNDVIRGDRLRMTIQGVEDPSALNIRINGEIVAPEVVYLYLGDAWVVVFTPAAELKVGSNNTITAEEGNRGDSVGLEVFANRPTIETPPFVVSVIPENQVVNPDELVEITMNEGELTGQQVVVEIIALDGQYTNPPVLIEGDAISFHMPTFVGKVLLMVRVGGKELLDYVDFTRG